MKDRTLVLLGILVIVGSFTALTLQTRTNPSRSSPSSAQFTSTVKTITPHAGWTLLSGNSVSYTAYTLTDGITLGTDCNWGLSQPVAYTYETQYSIAIVYPANCSVYSNS